MVNILYTMLVFPASIDRLPSIYLIAWSSQNAHILILYNLYPLVPTWYFSLKTAEEDETMHSALCALHTANCPQYTQGWVMDSSD